MSRGTLPTSIAWALIVPWLVWAVVRVFGLESGSAAVAAISFTPLAAATAAIPLLVALLLRVWPAAIAAAAVLAALLAVVLPRAFGEPTEPAGEVGPPLEVMAANMMLGKGSAESLAGLVDRVQPDVLSVEELTPGLARRLDRLGLAESLPHRVLVPDSRSHGSGLYSRLPIRSAVRTRLPGGFPLITGTIEPAAAAPVELTSVHTVPPNVAGWEEDLAAVPTADPGRAQVLLGDFNATADHAAFRDVLDSGWDDAASAVGSGLTPTWPLGRGLIPPLVAIDHVLVTPAIGVRAFAVDDVEGSDHRAVSAELALPAG